MTTSELDGLTGEMNGLKLRLSALQLDPAAVQRFVGKIEMQDAVLQAQLTDAEGLQGWLTARNVGSFGSAATTKQHLQEDIAQFITALGEYRRYLTAYREAVEVTSKNIQEISE